MVGREKVAGSDNEYRRQIDSLSRCSASMLYFFARSYRAAKIRHGYTMFRLDALLAQNASAVFV